MSRIFVCVFFILCLGACATHTYTPDYPLTVSSELYVEAQEMEFEAGFDYVENVAVFTLTSPEELAGMKLSVTADTVSVIYENLHLDYERKSTNKFTVFTDLYDVLTYINSQKPQLTRNGSLIDYEFIYNNTKGKIMIDSDTYKLVEVDFDKIKYIFS